MSHLRSIDSLSLPSSILQSLSRHGYRTIDDLLGIQAIDLQEDCGLQSSEAIDVIRSLQIFRSVQTSEYRLF